MGQTCAGADWQGGSIITSLGHESGRICLDCDKPEVWGPQGVISCWGGPVSMVPSSGVQWSAPGAGVSGKVYRGTLYSSSTIVRMSLHTRLAGLVGRVKGII